MGVRKWLDVFNLWSDSEAAQAEQRVRDGIPTDVLMAADKDASRRRHERVQQAAGDVVAQRVAAQEQLDQLVKRANELRQLIVSCGQRHAQLKETDPAGAQKQFDRGARLSSELAGVIEEIKACSQLLEQAKAASETAHRSAAAADQQLAADERQASQLAMKQKQAALATATTASLRALNDATSSSGSNFGGAADRINAQYAAAIGEQEILSNSTVADEAAARAEMAQQAGADLFQQVLDGGVDFNEDLDGNGVPDWMENTGNFAAGGKFAGQVPGSPAPAAVASS